MTLEVILWWVAWVVISEIIFVIGYLWIRENWIAIKFFSFCIGGIIMILQLEIVSGFDDALSLTNANYMNLFYEFLILVGIGILFLINYLIQSYINKKQKRANGREKSF